jgi:two-component system response regulator AtoC
MVLMAVGPLITMKLVPADVAGMTGESSAASLALPEEGTGHDVLKSHMEGMERQIIARCLEECGGNVTRAAERLGLSRKGLQLKMIKHHLRKPKE